MTKIIYSFFIIIVSVALHFRYCMVMSKTVKHKTYTDGIDIGHFNEKNEYNTVNYLKKQKQKQNLYNNREETKETNKNLLNTDVINDNSTLIDINNAERIKKLKNKNVLHELRKTYSEKGLDNEDIIIQIKKIVSEALNIPFNKLHLHDLNMIMRKWKNINKNKNKNNLEELEENTDDYYLKEIRGHGEKKQIDSENLEEDELVEISNGKLEDDPFVTIDYLLELVN